MPRDPGGNAIRTAKVIKTQSWWQLSPYLQLELPDGTRAAVPAGFAVMEGDTLAVLSKPVANMEPVPTWRQRRDKRRQVKRR